MDITKKTACFTRENLSYILVYNETKNSSDLADETDVQDSASRTVIAKYFIESKAKKKFIRFDLERFEKLYFKEVFTYNRYEFESNFVSKYTTAV